MTMRLVTTLPCWLVIVFLFASGKNILASEEVVADQAYFQACSEGHVDQVQEMLMAHPDWVHASTKHGETCLLLAAIPGSSPLIKMLLEAGADPNVRTTSNMGMRMHPLGWSVYGGHHENVKLLLDYGADVNADMDDAMMLLGGIEHYVTVFDILNQFMILSPDESEVDENGLEDAERDMKAEMDDRLVQTRTILLQYGAKTYSESIQVEDEYEFSEL